MSTPENQGNPLFNGLKDLLHAMVDLIPWHEETVRNAAHDAVDTHADPAPAEPVGRNETPAGVVEQTETPKNGNTGNANSFPGNSQE